MPILCANRYNMQTNTGLVVSIFQTQFKKDLVLKELELDNNELKLVLCNFVNSFSFQRSLILNYMEFGDVQK